MKQKVNVQMCMWDMAFIVQCKYIMFLVLWN